MDWKKRGECFPTVLPWFYLCLTIHSSRLDWSLLSSLLAQLRRKFSKQFICVICDVRPVGFVHGLSSDFRCCLCYPPFVTLRATCCSTEVGDRQQTKQTSSIRQLNHLRNFYFLSIQYSIWIRAAGVRSALNTAPTSVATRNETDAV